ncbi:migration and invasion-inhibitory protein isoform X2 [Bos taurus]|uniref:migration and invasion-inhibitory protein isoform X2 n=1 Tax=Bos taurus TaxID=9913 RepID=UPI000383D406|nr:migration and invasion-inhibitory protein isoform X2 [Bos taurus]
MVETRDLVQLRQLNLELLRQLWVRQDAVQRSVAKAASESSLDSSSSYDSEMPSSQEMSSVASRASCPQDAHPGDPCGRYWPGDASSGMNSLLPATCLYRESLGPPRPHSAPLLAISDSSDPELSAELDSPGTQEAQALRSILAQQGKLSKRALWEEGDQPHCADGKTEVQRTDLFIVPHGGGSGGSNSYPPAPKPSAEPWGLRQSPRVTNKESPVPEKSWRLRPYLGYDWIAGSLDNTFPVTSKPEAFFSKLQKFREANKEECICSGPEPQFLGLQESDAVEGDHECVYCYRVNRRLFLVPADPGTPCRLCRKPRDQRGAGTLAEPAQVRVSIPLSVLDPPHRHRIHRRKSFDASDTLALPRHCLLGWDIIPPKSEKSSAPKTLDLWSSVSPEAHHQKLSATSCPHLAVPMRVPPPTPIWSEPSSMPRPRSPKPKP